jgi:hypothetical protein
VSPLRRELPPSIAFLASSFKILWPLRRDGRNPALANELGRNLVILKIDHPGVPFWRRGRSGDLWFLIADYEAHPTASANGGAENLAPVATVDLSARRRDALG